MSLTLQMIVYVMSFLTLCLFIYIFVKYTKNYNKVPKTIIEKEINTNSEIKIEEKKNANMENNEIQQITIGDLDEIKSMKEKTSAKS